MSKYDDMTGPQLVQIYNEAAQSLGEKPVKRFPNKATAIKRTSAMVARAGTPKRVGNTKRTREINWPKRKERHAVRKGTLGERFVNLLSSEKGATQEQLEKALADHDESKGNPTWDVQSRVRATLRMLHTYNGFGIKTVDNRLKLVG